RSGGWRGAGGVAGAVGRGGGWTTMSLGWAVGGAGRLRLPEPLVNVKANILDAVGNVPLVKLNKVVGPESATVLVKCEYMNPTGSIKDRMAVHVLEESVRRGLLKPGMTIVENTSGNTGQGVAMWAAVRGYRCVFTMPDKMSVEKVNMLKA